MSDKLFRERVMAAAKRNAPGGGWTIWGAGLHFGMHKQGVESKKLVFWKAIQHDPDDPLAQAELDAKEELRKELELLGSF